MRSFPLKIIRGGDRVLVVDTGNNKCPYIASLQKVIQGFKDITNNKFDTS